MFLWNITFKPKTVGRVVLFYISVDSNVWPSWRQLDSQTCFIYSISCQSNDITTRHVASGKLLCACERMRVKKMLYYENSFDPSDFLKGATLWEPLLSNIDSWSMNGKSVFLWKSIWFRLITFSSCYWVSHLLHPDEIPRFTGLITASVFLSLIKLVVCSLPKMKDSLFSNTSLPVLTKILNDKTVSTRHCILFETTIWNKGMETTKLLFEWFLSVHSQCCAGQLTFHSFEIFMR